MPTLGTRIKLAFAKNPYRFVVDMLVIVILLVNFFLFATTVFSWPIFLGILLVCFIYAKVIRSVIGWN